MASDIIPGLPHEIAQECLIRVPYDTFPAIRYVCRLWKQELESQSYHNLRLISGLTEPVVAVSQAEPAMASAGPAKKYSVAGLSYRLSLFHPATGSWTGLPAIPGLQHGIPLFCQLNFVGRQLVVIGGWDPATWTASDWVFVYDFLSATWRRGAPLPGPRRSFFASAASDGLVFVAGGHDEEKNALRSGFVYDVAADVWAPLPDMAMERDEPRGLFMYGKFHVVGGYSTDEQGRFVRSGEVFDPFSWSWGPVEEGWLEDEGTCPGTCVSCDGKVYMVKGGAHVVVREGDTWRVLGELPDDVRVAAKLAVVGPGRVVVVGSGCHADIHVAYLLSEVEGKGVTWTRLEVPRHYWGHVQSACSVEL